MSLNTCFSNWTIEKEFEWLLNLVDCNNFELTTLDKIQITFQITIATLILFGSTLVIGSILRFKRLQTKTHFFTAKLAFADFLVGIALPCLTIYIVKKELIFEKLTCLPRYLIMMFTCSDSMSTILLISFERYIAIVYPLHYQMYMNKRTITIMVILAYANSISLSVMPFFLNNWSKLPICVFEHVVNNIYILIFALEFLFVCSSIIIIYTKIFLIARAQLKKIASLTATFNTNNDFDYHSTNNHNNRKNKKNIQNETKSAKLFATVLGFFLVCWLPYIALTLHQNLIFNSPTLHTCSVMALILGTLNSVVNPVIYAAKNKTLRAAFKGFLKMKGRFEFNDVSELNI